MERSTKSLLYPLFIVMLFLSIKAWPKHLATYTQLQEKIEVISSVSGLSKPLSSF